MCAVLKNLLHCYMHYNGIADSIQAVGGVASAQVYSTLLGVYLLQNELYVCV